VPPQRTSLLPPCIGTRQAEAERRKIRIPSGLQPTHPEASACRNLAAIRPNVTRAMPHRSERQDNFTETARRAAARPGAGCLTSQARVSHCRGRPGRRRPHRYAWAPTPESDEDWRLSGRAALELCADVTARAYCPDATSLEASTTSGDEDESAGASAAASCDAPESAGGVLQA
jgi:hypothetical protein